MSASIETILEQELQQQQDEQLPHHQQQQELRQRKNGTTTTTMNHQNHIDPHEDEDDLDDVSITALGISNSLVAPTLLQKGSPQYHGPVLKLHTTSLVWKYILPFWLQRILLRSPLWMQTVWRCCLLGTAPTWKRRYLILCGSFLYKFLDSSHPRRGPKGRPIDISSVEIKLLQVAPSSTTSTTTTMEHDDMAVVLQETLPPGWNAVVVLKTLRHEYYYACPTEESAKVWVASLKEARHERVRRQMGHAVRESYPKVWDTFDLHGRSLAGRYDRVEARMSQASMNDMEMSPLGPGFGASAAAGGTLPQGYFG